MDLELDWTRSETESVRLFPYMGRPGPAGSQTAGRFGFAQILKGLPFEIHDAGRHYGRL